MFKLTNNGGGRYSDQRGFVFNPQQISVRSNFGGSASAGPDVIAGGTVHGRG